jgi:hypothetical protein
MGIRRSMATGVLAALLVAGGASAASAADGAHRNGAKRCDRIAAETAHIQRELARIERGMQSPGGPGAARGARYQQRKDRAEQKLQSLQAACPS